MAAPRDATDPGSVSSGEVIEVDGMLWKPKPEATSTARSSGVSGR